MSRESETIIIAPSHLHYDLRRKKLQENRSKGMANITFFTLDRFLQRYQTQPPVNETSQLIAMYHLLKNFNAKVFDRVLCTPSFLKELQRVMNLLISNFADLSSFPEDTPSRQELKQILQLLRSQMRFRADERNEAMARILESNDLSHIELHNIMPRNGREEDFLNAMIQKGAKQSVHILDQCNVRYHYALNIRQEVEAVAQHLCEFHNDPAFLSDTVIMVSDIKRYAAFIDQVFTRYQLPYTILNQKKMTVMKRCFHAIFTFYAKPSVSSLLDILSLPVFGIPNIKQLQELLALFPIGLDQLARPLEITAHLNEHVSSQTRNRLTDLEQKANVALEGYQELFIQIESSSFSSMIKSFYQQIIRRQTQLDVADIEFLQSLRTCFDDVMEDLDSLPMELACTIAIDMLDQLGIELPRMTNSILVTDIQHAPLPVTYGFALGFYQDTYPGFQPLSGIFDETVAAMLPDFEPLSRRYHRHLLHRKRNLHFAKELIVSYPQGDFQGKTYESSLDLELQFGLGKAAPWTLKENEYRPDTIHRLDPELSKALFFRQDQLTGSISRFESYFRCPYSFFLKYGLQLEEPLRFSLMEAEIGQIYHGFFETIVAQRQKHYTDASDDDINCYLAKALAPYRAIYTDQTEMFDLIAEQLHYQIRYNLDQLKQIENQTSFIPTKTEHPFEMVICEFGGTKIRLKGIIDRIDEVAHGFRILDYKSSSHELRIKDFYAGQKLQLITYTYIAAQQLNKKPFGCYYINLRQPSLTHEPFHIDRRRKTAEYIEEEDCLAENQKPNKMKGLTFIQEPSDIVLLDASQSYIQGLASRKAGPTVTRPADFGQLSLDLIKIYQNLADRLLSGRIELEPVESACTYCKFRIICQFRGKARKPQPIIEMPLQETKEEEA